MKRNAHVPTGKAGTISRGKAALAAGLAGAAVLGLFAAAQSANSAPPREPVASVSTVSPYVVNHFGEENADTGRAERRPKDLVLSEFTGIHRVTWRVWGATKAVGTGEVTGTWCLDTCLDKPLKATIVLSDPRTVDGRVVYSAFTLAPAGRSDAYDSEDLQGKRPLATR
ncbi:hypothetical protein L1085_002470 [Streptomyces sp. MSC1_001]|jgi:hypothetical protein|uniref:hypothetical protein n=1 Tax=Streptomyces sp. MSC1_001 TaxID=2909263 RepID=UPI002030D2CF|nr:hypothetical protein [Streptomyces sp. MSC1_001]